MPDSDVKTLLAALIVLVAFLGLLCLRAPRAIYAFLVSPSDENNALFPVYSKSAIADRKAAIEKQL